MFVLIESADVEIVSVRLFAQGASAAKTFERCCSENQVVEWEAADLAREIKGTRRLAGDDAYSVQLLEINPEAEPEP